MHILIVGLNFAPEPTGVGKYSGEMASWLKRRGHSVSIVTAPPYYPFWKIEDGYRGWRWKREVIEGNSVVRCPLYVPEHPTGLKRSLHLASFGMSSFPAAVLSAIGKRPDVVVAIVPTLCSLPAALTVARMTGARSWVHVQDLEVDAAFELGILQRRSARRAALSVERSLLSRFDMVSTISEAMLDRIAAKGIAKDKLTLFPNWVDTDKITPSDQSPILRRKLGIPDWRVVALYSGSMGEKHGLEAIIEAARQAADTSLQFVIAGDGPGKAQLVAEAAGLSNVTLLPLQPADRLNDFLALADIHLLPQREDAAELVMPSKLNGMLASGRPIVAMVTPGSQVGRLVVSCGRLTPPGNVAALTAVLRQLAMDSDTRARFGRAARDAAMKLAQDKVLGELEMGLERLVAS